LKYKISIFFIIGILIYVIDLAFNSFDEKEIYISDQEIISLVGAWKSQVGRNPTDDEIVRIINNLVEEEILYREALNLGLDKDDKIIKRRLAQKISFLKQESIIDTPSNNELLDYFNNNKDKYFIEPTFTFTHYYFSNENDALKRSNDAIKEISKNLDVSSDPFFLGKNFVDVSLKSIKSDFGEDFATYFNNFKVNEWSDPVESAYGYHIILVKNSNDGFYPDISMVLKQVEIDLLQSRRDKAISEYLDNIKSEYKIYINPNLQI
tara:strand:+ start:2318 stop:3112 length:795 start_codon:yes stop_codon:yes gene_type:complete